MTTNVHLNIMTTTDIRYGPADFSFFRREKCSPGKFSYYKKFFRGTTWELVLEPARSLDKSLDDARRHGVNEALWEVPAVYEFSVAKSIGGKRYKTYVGTTKNLKQRHAAYLRDGDHIREYLEHAVRSGFFVYRRFRYIIPRKTLAPNDHELAALIAEQTETRFLGKYNFAWNSANNGHKAMTRMPAKTSFLCMFTRMKWLRHPDAKKFQR